MPAQAAHIPVLLDQAIEALQVRPDGIYIDGTFGRGGHSERILALLGDKGRLLAFDKDAEAVRVAQARFGDDRRFSITHGSFADIPIVVGECDLVHRIDGLLLDLGVSSPQLDDPTRGFSFLNDGPLDMRMDQSRGQSAAQWLAEADEEDIATVIYEYGEERFSRRIARAIVARRQDTPITGTRDLADLVAQTCPIKEKRKHPATRTFQAIRIFINRELDDLQQCLQGSLEVLAQGARLVVISFHSLEDRIVKRFMRDAAQGPRLPKGLPVRHVDTRGQLQLVGKATRASAVELHNNPRARSAVMRVAEVGA
ncbi:MAG: 16S rRNA (cytosine(1402)-N(4))-methyltransferase RsmH [Gammaproteobacteria bacterium]|nr:16S rRNA (cytosine(1402)-N(4))-methyltransferase RsmH [Gammaproteobacteria bacterium]MCP5317659.1 16S rRNA (cytosine(1402)-N(4))-methyltransferase RsmH [Chromatiaceae bacterium]MCW5587085.1 16S rRNA (cytosine(1402)-N(4))-methyltransferase RsmH [Chromatiales bacterium]MCB1817247.1 16S rRNA (cytosine(1402)-N(4))-methyltransferase RsmH [Gammaproteobacteria bacterium]MCP5430841.1 16S rRNA (cytosine(1402)-N(4))-methyltransferase RsmH [Chromatiaceae bacterium]